jgi:hypothetical protein
VPSRASTWDLTAAPVSASRSAGKSRIEFRVAAASSAQAASVQPRITRALRHRRARRATAM